MPTKEQDFGEWYNETVDKAELCDKRYPIKGMNVWTPYGWKIMSQIDSFLRREMEATEHDEVCFPLLIPESEFKKEKDHIKGFDEEVYWVTHAGLNPLDIRLVLRPTSETAMYPMFSLWVRSHQDLPLKVFQIVNTFRYETKQTRAFMRVREIHFFESHTCHADREDAAQLAADCERFGLLSAADLREGIARYMSARLSAAGYSIHIESGLDIPAKVMFNAYFEEKGVPFRLP